MWNNGQQNIRKAQNIAFSCSLLTFWHLSQRRMHCDRMHAAYIGGIEKRFERRTVREDERPSWFTAVPQRNKACPSKFALLISSPSNLSSRWEIHPSPLAYPSALASNVLQRPSCGSQYVLSIRTWDHWGFILQRFVPETCMSRLASRWEMSSASLHGKSKKSESTNLLFYLQTNFVLSYDWCAKQLRPWF